MREGLIEPGLEQVPRKCSEGFGPGITWRALFLKRVSNSPMPADAQCASDAAKPWVESSCARALPHRRLAAGNCDRPGLDRLALPFRSLCGCSASPRSDDKYAAHKAN